MQVEKSSNIMDLFIDKLINQIKEKKSIICIGLDPRINEKNSIPQYILEKSSLSHSNIHKANNNAIWEFNKGIIDATHTITPIYKPQIAFYERYGALKALKRTIDYIHQKGCLSLLDAKRNDIGSTSEAYAKTAFDHFKADAVTVNSYFGIDGVKPFLKFLNKGKGVILLLKTSNPSSAEFQDLFSIDLSDENLNPTQMQISLNSIKQINNKERILVRNYIQMARLMKKWIETREGWDKEDILVDKEGRGQYGYSSVGGVVGATYPEQLKQIRKEIPNSFILIPGYGAQGGAAEDIIHGINDDGLGAIVNSSRGINFAYQSPENKEKFSEKEFAEAAYYEAEKMRKAINIELKKQGKIAYSF